MNGRIIVVQPAVPVYREDFFDRLHRHFGDSFKVYSAPLSLGALTAKQFEQTWCLPTGSIVDLPGGFQWQKGALRIRIERGDHVIVWGSMRSLSSIALALKARLLGARSYWWGHYRSHTSSSTSTWFRNLTARVANTRIFYTDLEAKQYTQAVRKDQKHISLNNGIDIEKIPKKFVKFDAESKSLFYIGRLEKNKNLGTLLEALAISNTSERLHVVGDGSYRSKLENYATELNVASKVTWHGALVREQDIYNVARNCSLFVYPSAVGLSLLHSYAYGLPSVLRSGEWEHGPEIAAFEEGKTGLSFNADDPVDFATKIDVLLSSPRRLEAMSQRAREIVENSFNTKVMSERFITELNSAGT